MAALTGTSLSVAFILSILKVSGATYEQLALPRTEYSLPSLPYAFGDLEPFLDEATVKVHLQGHHATYTNNLNAALAAWRGKFPEDKMAYGSILSILQNIQNVPESFRTTIRNQGGGYLNHCLYWACMSANPRAEDRKPEGHLFVDMQRSFGSFEGFLDAFSERAKTVFGSGYVWLSRKGLGELVISTTVNQDSPVSEGLKPILTLDVWEHAYYLKFQFRRLNYLENWWRLVDWKAVEQLDSWWREAKLQKDEL